MLLFRIAAIVIIIAIGALMFVIGRGHTIYFDNMEAEYDGKSYAPFYKVAVIKDNEKVAKLAEDEKNVIFGGRLGNYRYYDMDKVIEAALEVVEKEA